MYIRNLLSTIDYKHIEIIIKNLNKKERNTIIKNLESKKTNEFDQISEKKLLDKIEKIKNYKLPITRKKDRKSPLALFKRRLNSTIDKFAYFLGFPTARKTQYLVNKALNISNSPLEKNFNFISEKDLKKLLKKEKLNSSGKIIDLKAILTKYGFSPIIKDCRLTNKNLSNVDFKDITFRECTFDWCHFNNTSLSNITFDGCNFLNTNFSSAEIKNCCFHNCNFQEVMFTGAQIEHSNWSSCSIIGTSFEDTILIDCTFLYSHLPASHFLESSAKNSHFMKCNLQDTVFFDTFEKFIIDQDSKKTALVTKPITAILVSPENRGITTPKAYMKLDQSAHTIPLRISLNGQKANPKIINAEIKKALIEIGPYDRSKTPIPQQLIQNIKENPNKFNENMKLLKKAEKLASEVNGFLLPGGEDIPPALYGQKVEKHTNWGNDYRRSIFELSIIHECFNKGIPLMALCRGFQMTNIYFGSQLLQDVKGHRGIQKFQMRKNTGLYHRIFQKSLKSAVYHHQAVSKKTFSSGKLEASVIYQNIIKACELEDHGVPMILLQFHPEFYKATTAHNMKREFTDFFLRKIMSKRNEGFWQIFSNSAKTNQSKKKMLSELKSQFSNKFRRGV